MSRYDLSILIPARSEMWLRRTVEDILDHSGERTEVIVVLDGDWGEPGDPDGDRIPEHPRVTALYEPEPVGQRAATNLAASLSEARWVMKADAHCAFAPGFDEELMAAMEGHADWTIVPAMHNLHVFDWLCHACDEAGRVLDKKNRRPPGRLYQRPTPDACPGCGGPMVRDVVWAARPSPYTTAMRFDKELRFRYWGEYKRRQEGDLVETMSLLGACFMLTRERYWELDICDEAHGSWGQQGTEVACKTWLSGGSLIVDKRTWFAHMFRTQGGDFGFPYPQHGREVDKAREYSRNLWLGGGWPKATRPLSWLIDHFAPVPDWETPKLEGKGIVYYTDNRLNVRLARAAQKQIRNVGVPITSVSLKPMPGFGKNVVLPHKRGILTMFRQILAGLEACNAETVFFCEHDVLYHPSHFEFEPERDDVYYYNTNVWRVRLADGFAVRTDDCRQTSGLCARRELLIGHYRERIRRCEEARDNRDGLNAAQKRLAHRVHDGYAWGMGFEPGTHGRPERIDDYRSDRWESTFPNVDIRHGGNVSKEADRWSPNGYRNPRYAEGWQESTVDDIPGWADLRSLLRIASDALLVGV